MPLFQEIKVLKIYIETKNFVQSFTNLLVVYISIPLLDTILDSRLFTTALYIYSQKAMVIYRGALSTLILNSYTSVVSIVFFSSWVRLIDILEQLARGGYFSTTGGANICDQEGMTLQCDIVESVRVNHNTELVVFMEDDHKQPSSIIFFFEGGTPPLCLSKQLQLVLFLKLILQLHLVQCVVQLVKM